MLTAIQLLGNLTMQVVAEILTMQMFPHDCYANLSLQDLHVTTKVYEAVFVTIPMESKNSALVPTCVSSKWRSM